MEEFRKFWADMVNGILNWIATGLVSLYRGILYEWNLTYFIFAVGGIVILWAFLLWRRRA